MDGWIKLHRQLEEAAFFKDSEAVHLWITLLLKACHKEREVYLNGKTIQLNRGQFITGRKKLAEQTGIHESKIFRLLKTFEEKFNQIEQQTNSRYSIITIKNWDIYQDNEQQMNNKRTTVEQQLNTNKNEKKEVLEEELECKNIINSSFSGEHLFYGEYKNVGLTNHQKEKLIALTLSEEALSLLINDLGKNIEQGKDKMFSYDLPNLHFERLKAYWDYRRKHPEKFLPGLQKKPKVSSYKNFDAIEEYFKKKEETENEQNRIY